MCLDFSGCMKNYANVSTWIGLNMEQISTVSLQLELEATASLAV